MGIGVSVFLMAVGAILTFAVNLRVHYMDLDAVGWILMAAGALGLVVTLIVWGRRRRVVTDLPPVGPGIEDRDDIVRPYERPYPR